MKSAFEQVYGAPYLARMLFAEVGESPEEDSFLRVEYDGEIATNGAVYGQVQHGFAVLSGTAQSRELMEEFLNAQHAGDATFDATVKSALDAWTIGQMASQAGDTTELPDRAAVSRHRQEQLASRGIEAAILERDTTTAIRYRSLSDTILRKLSNE
jgi:proteasome alpha subunit